MMKADTAQSSFLDMCSTLYLAQYNCMCGCLTATLCRCVADTAHPKSISQARMTWSPLVHMLGSRGE